MTFALVLFTHFVPSFYLILHSYYYVPIACALSRFGNNNSINNRRFCRFFNNLTGRKVYKVVMFDGVSKNTF